MRVSAVGWLYPTLERTREVAAYTAEVTHNHPEGIKGAEATASCIFLARHEVNKEGIREYVIKEFGYDLNRTLEEIRPTYHHVESCQQTVPEAIIAFLESENYEDAVRNAVSLGGDTDTLAAITGSIAEAFYDMSAILRAECRNRVSEDILNLMQLFDDGNDGTVYQTLPWNHRGWHSGSSINGSANNTHIGVEMCEPACITYVGGATFKCSDITTVRVRQK